PGDSGYPLEADRGPAGQIPIGTGYGIMAGAMQWNPHPRYALPDRRPLPGQRRARPARRRISASLADLRTGLESKNRGGTARRNHQSQNAASRQTFSIFRSLTYLELNQELCNGVNFVVMFSARCFYHFSLVKR